MHPAPIASVRILESFDRRASLAILVLVVTALAVTPSLSDTVVRTNGKRVEGRVVSVDATSVVVQVRGNRVRLERGEVESIHFQSAQAPAPLKIEMRVAAVRDEMEVRLGERTLVRGTRSGGSWIDITPHLADGNNALSLRIRNGRGNWAYRLSVRINGEVVSVGCGDPELDERCDCCGLSGREIGLIEDLPELWIHVDRETGRAEVLP